MPARPLQPPAAQPQDASRRASGTASARCVSAPAGVQAGASEISHDHSTGTSHPAAPRQLAAPSGVMSGLPSLWPCPGAACCTVPRCRLEWGFRPRRAPLTSTLVSRPLHIALALKPSTPDDDRGTRRQEVSHSRSRSAGRISTSTRVAPPVASSYRRTVEPQTHRWGRLGRRPAHGHILPTDPARCRVRFVLGPDRRQGPEGPGLASP